MKSAQLIDFSPEYAADLLKRARANELHQSDCEIIEAMISTIIVLKESYEKGKLHIKRLLKMIFGSKTEKRKNVFPDKTSVNDPKKGEPGPVDETKQNADKNQPEKTTRGHGRNGADAFAGAEKQFVAHTVMKPGDPCTFCDGRVYEYKKPKVLIRFFGQAPVKAKVWILERLRCNLCGAMFTPELPEQAKGEKYDQTAISMIALSRYGFGIPFYRLQNLQACLSMPLPASSQWDKAEQGADRIYPAFEQLKHQAAQASVVHNDDTPMKILELMKENDKDQNPDLRKGMCTTGIVSIKDDIKMVLFFTGRQHAGENIADVLKHRDPQRPPPIQMCDALSRNFSQYDNVVLSHCNTHARRRFVDVADNFEDECSYVLSVFEKIYKNDAVAKKNTMSDHQRLQFHQDHSGPVMEEFHQWLKCCFDDKKVEPNSGLGEAITYALKYWPELTRFLNTPGAPLDNNICERILKGSILHRKNSLFYKTAHGAYIGDMYMSLIHTCILNKINPFDYLTSLQINCSEVFKNPDQWMPWNYKATISSFESKSAS
jgi:transposase